MSDRGDLTELFGSLATVVLLLAGGVGGGWIGFHYGGVLGAVIGGLFGAVIGARLVAG